MNLREKFFDQTQCESYYEFLNRIYSFEKPEFSFWTDRFEPSQSVSAKVDYDGSFKHFIGDTTVFNLSDVDKAYIQWCYVDPLYDVAGECLAEKFETSTFHMTLHDLNATGTNDYDVLNRMFYTEIELARRIAENKIANQSIKMKTTCVFNMVNTSLVLGLVPKTQDDYIKLMSLYNMVDSVYKLPYSLTPHITLAYYNRNGITGDNIRAIETVVNSLNCGSLEITLSTDNLYYQKFTNMNDFFNIMSFVKENNL